MTPRQTVRWALCYDNQAKRWVYAMTTRQTVRWILCCGNQLGYVLDLRCDSQADCALDFMMWQPDRLSAGFML